MKYPIYRRNHNTRSFFKIISENEILTVRFTNNETKVSLSRSAYNIAEAQLATKTRPSTPEEFEREFKKADEKFFNVMPEA